MFVLIHSDNELLEADNEVTVFPTHDAAWTTMVEEFVSSLEKEGIEPVIPVDGGDVCDREDRLIVGYVNESEAYTEHCEEKWVIFEVKE